MRKRENVVEMVAGKTGEIGNTSGVHFDGPKIFGARKNTRKNACIAGILAESDPKTPFNRSQNIFKTKQGGWPSLFFGSTCPKTIHVDQN